ncbi:MAG TPA: hypothetical protein VGD08_11070 [Stellaceae bacterium]
MRRSLTSMCLCLLLSACYGIDDVDRVELSDFRPIGTDEFHYFARTTPFYGPGPGTWAGSARLRWLADYLDIFGMCPAGYVLVKRDAIFRDLDPLGYPTDEIAYEGRCRS